MAKPSRCKTVAVADDALERGLKPRMAADIADAAMPEPGDIIDQLAHRLAIVDADLIERRIGRAIDQDARQPRRVQIDKRAALRVGARRQNDAVDATLMKRGQDRELAGRVVLGVGEEDHHAEPGALGLDGADDVAEIGIGDGRNGDPDRLRRGRFKGTREHVGMIADRVDDGLDGARGRGRNAPRPIHDVRDRRDRNARLPRHVGNRRHFPSRNVAPYPRTQRQSSSG